MHFRHVSGPRNAKKAEWMIWLLLRLEGTNIRLASTSAAGSDYWCEIAEAVVSKLDARSKAMLMGPMAHPSTEEVCEHCELFMTKSDC
jgi:hypothetical protein